MNEYEYLYDKKKSLLEEIRKHKIFKLNIKDAVYCVMVKVGMLSCMFRLLAENEKQEYLKKLVHTNCTVIDESVFIQESLKWICRWCSEYCSPKSDYNENVYADEIYELMGQAYAYEIFNDFSFFHSKKIVKYQKIANIINFDYLNEENYRVHVLYDKILQRMHDDKESKNVLNNRGEKTDLELIERSHRIDFNFGYNFNFGNFNLKDYEEFSAGLNNYVFDKIRKPHVVIPGEEGLICLSRHEWVNLLSKESGLSVDTVENIIDFFQYNYQEENADLSLTYFFQQEDGRLLLSEYIFLFQRPAVNALRLLAKRQSELYKAEQNAFEDEQKRKIIDLLSDRYEITKVMTKEQQLRPGMDMLVYDRENKNLQVIELKYKIPIESARDITNLDEMLKKAYGQIMLAEKYVKKNTDTILEEYFGISYHGIVPNNIDYFVLTNYSIGTGMGVQLPSPILLEEHYLWLMKLENGMEYIHEVLVNKEKKCIGIIKKRYARFSLPNCKFKIPDYTIDKCGMKL